MPRAGGVYTLPAGNPVVTLTVISSAWANTTMSDIATALTGSVPTDGSAPMTGALRLVDGAVGTPGLTWATETTSGLYRIGAGDFGFSIAGTKVIELKNTTTTLTVFGVAAGNVAILGGVTISTAGTVVIAAPTAGTALSINGVAGNIVALFSGIGTAAGVTFQRNASSIGDIGSGDFAVSGGNAADFALTSRAGALVLGSNSATRLTISNAGSVTIAAPSSGIALAITGSTGGGGNTALTVQAGAGQRGAVVFGVDGSFTLAVFAGTTASNSFGLQVRAGTNAADLAFSVNNAANTLAYLTVDGAGGVQLGSPTGAGQGLGTLNATGLFVNGVAGAPQNSQAAAYQLVLADAGKSIYHPAADAARIWTIPANTTVAFPIGTMISFDNDISAGSITISITTDTLVFVPSGTTGSRILANGGQATARKITATRWMISGVGLT